VSAQPGAFDPFPAGSASSYHFDLARNFFRTPEEEATARRGLVTQLAKFDPPSRDLARSADRVLEALRLQDSLDLEVSRHVTYLNLRYFSDTRNTEGFGDGGRLRAIADQRFAPFNSALASLPDAVITRMEEVQPQLRRYRFAIESSRRQAPRRLTPEGEDVLKTLGPLATGWGAQVFSLTYASTDFGSVNTASGMLSVERDYTAIAAHPDPRVRKEGYLRNNNALAQHREVYAAILVRTAEALNAVARLRGYADYADQTYAERFLDRARVVAFLDSLAEAADVNKRIERAVIDHCRGTFGLDTVHVWDLWLPEPGLALPRFTIVEATQLVQEATKPLGDGYSRELARLLDPANGRLDVAPGPHKANRQGFSAGLVGFPSMFYQGQFGGNVEDVVTLAHESGHAVQNMFMTSNDVLTRYASGPAYFTESFAGLSELLVLEHLYRHAPDRKHKIFYLRRLINQGAEIFRTGWESRVEQELFDSVGAGKRPGADDIETMTQATASKFSVWSGPDSERQLAWLQPTQYFTRPLYRVNYVYSKLLALRYLDLLHRESAGFSRRYSALLSNGYDAPPDSLLRRFVGISLDDPALVRGAAGVLESWLKEFESLCSASTGVRHATQ
jgi:oligoendopeptidase F